MVKVLSKIAEPVVNVNEVSRIAAGVVIKGEITSPSDIRIDGTVEGSVRSEGKIVVGEAAEIKGTIYCNMLDFWGKIEGDLYVRDTLSLKGTSSVKGNLHIRRFQVEMGAAFDGNCSMITEEEFDQVRK